MNQAVSAAGRALPRWQQELAEAVRDPAELISLLGLDPALLPAARRAAELFPLRVPRGFVARMRAGEPDDPLLRQVLPLAAECAPAPGYSLDPVGDLSAQQARGVLHKYRGRVLLVATGACAVHCRYCFRRHFPYAEANAAAGGWGEALDYLRAHADVDEVILSGGDPLVLADHKLFELFAALEAIPHLRRLRIHSRLPVVLPSRVTPELVERLAAGRLKPVLVIHANHAQELDEKVAAALAPLRRAGVLLLNQAVLLKGINDTVAALSALSERLFELGVQPYYLHQLDRVQGAAHFDLAEQPARALLRELAAALPGYLVPKLVREIAGEPGKTPIAP